MIISFKNTKQNLFQPVDALPLGIFRFLFGFLLCVEFLVLSRRTFPHYYIEPAVHFPYPLFDLLGLKPMPQTFLWPAFYVLQVSTVGIMLGLLTRISFVIFTATFGYFFFMESAPYTNHYYLIFLLAFLMCFGHSGSIFSFDSVINKHIRREQVHYWELFVLRFQICVVFVFAGIAKVNADWLIYAAPLYLNLVKHLSFMGYHMEGKWVAVVLSWGGMCSDLGLGILLFINRWHRLTFMWLCLFNGMNIFLFGLGIQTFPYLMVSTYILFVPSPIVRDSIKPFLNSKFLKYVPILDET
jgi:Vitamin K-dependent gamma-carboxylase